MIAMRHYSVQLLPFCFVVAVIGCGNCGLWFLFLLLTAKRLEAVSALFGSVFITSQIQSTGSVVHCICAVKVDFVWQTTTMRVADVCIQIGAETGTDKVLLKLANTYIIQTYYIAFYLKRPLIFIQL